MGGFPPSARKNEPRRSRQTLDGDRELLLFPILHDDDNAGLPCVVVFDGVVKTQNRLAGHGVRSRGDFVLQAQVFAAHFLRPRKIEEIMSRGVTDLE